MPGPVRSKCPRNPDLSPWNLASVAICTFAQDPCIFFGRITLGKPAAAPAKTPHVDKHPRCAQGPGAHCKRLAILILSMPLSRAGCVEALM